MKILIPFLRIGRLTQAAQRPARARLCALLWCIVGLSVPLGAAPFNSGSTGAYGPLNVTANTTLELPPDGIFHCTTVNVAQGVSLDFKKNPLNTPVYILATGDIQVGGTINVSGGIPQNNQPGRGGPGGFDGGYGGYSTGPTSQGGDGQGPGAGRNLTLAQHAAFALPANNNSNTYGNTLLVPLIGGSGGAGSDGNPGGYGGGGGGAILLASNTKITLNGAIQANGGAGAGSGSGGGIRLVAPVVEGRGFLHANSPYHGPSGRIRIDCEDRLAYRSLSVQAATISRGSQMFVFPAVVPRLDIVEAAGLAIPAGTANPVQVELPIGAPTNQTVVLRGRDFTGVVPVTVVVTPETGPSTSYPAQLNMATGNPAQTTVNVAIPAGNVSRIDAWAR